MKLSLVEFNQREAVTGSRSKTTTLRASEGWLLDRDDAGYVAVLHESDSTNTLRRYSPSSVRYVEEAFEPKGKLRK